MERDQRDKEGKLDTGTQLEYKEWKITQEMNLVYFCLSLSNFSLVLAKNILESAFLFF